MTLRCEFAQMATDKTTALERYGDHLISCPAYRSRETGIIAGGWKDLKDPSSYTEECNCGFREALENAVQTLKEEGRLKPFEQSGTQQAQTTDHDYRLLREDSDGQGRSLQFDDCLIHLDLYNRQIRINLTSEQLSRLREWGDWP